MILNEMDPISSRQEILPRLQKIFDELEQKTITKDQALDQLALIQDDVNMRAELSTASYIDAHNWAFLQITIENMIQFINELE